MRILILGGDGMLGHQLLKSWQQRHEVWVTLHRPLNTYVDYALFNKNNSFDAIDAHDTQSIERVLQHAQPDAVINAIGIIKQRSTSHEAIPSIEINALFPHRLHALCQQYKARLVHMSTDCVFSGHQGMYTEESLEDARDLYGRSKLLGEIHDEGAITLRTSIIGLELARKQSLIEWFLAQKGRIHGFTKAIYSGFTTIEMAHIIEMLLTRHPRLDGLYHVASTPISKYELLMMLSEFLERRDVIIEPDDSFCCDRSLDSSRFRRATGYQPATWQDMLATLAMQYRERIQL